MEKTIEWRREMSLNPLFSGMGCARHTIRKTIMVSPTGFLNVLMNQAANEILWAIAA